MVDTTRRSFLKGAAAAPVVVASAGSSVAGAAASALGATAQNTTIVKNALRKSIRLSKVWQSLVQSGGYPDKIIREMLKEPHRPYEQAPGDMLALQKRLFENGPLNRNPELSDTNRSGRISLQEEALFWHHLRKLPDDIPLMDLLDAEVYKGSRTEKENNGNWEVEGRRYSNNTAKRIEMLRHFLQPYCDDKTTARDVTARLRDYFVRLAEHAARNPEDFEKSATPYSPYNWSSIESSKGASLESLIHILRQYNKDAPDGAQACAPLIETLENHCTTRLRKLTDDTLKRQKEAEERIKRQDRAREEQEIQKKETQTTEPSLRSPAPASLLPLGQNRFALQSCGSGMPLPCRMDWLHWLQSLDPQNARPADITLDETGIIMTIRNAAALEKLRTLASTRSELITVRLPNRRMGLDLNQPAPAAPLHKAPGLA